MLPKTVMSKDITGETPLSDGYGYLEHEFRNFSTMMRRSDEQREMLSLQISSLRGDLATRKASLRDLKRRNTDVERSLEKEKSEHAALIKRIHAHVKDPELLDALLNPPEPKPEAPPASSGPGSQPLTGPGMESAPLVFTQKELHEALVKAGRGRVQPPSALPEPSRVFPDPAKPPTHFKTGSPRIPDFIIYSKPPPSQKTLMNYLGRFVGDSAWMFGDRKEELEELKKDVEKHQDMVGAYYDGRLGPQTRAERECSVVVARDELKAVAEMEWCQECGMGSKKPEPGKKEELAWFTLDTFPCENLSPELHQFYIDSQDLLMEGKEKEVMRRVKPFRRGRSYKKEMLKKLRSKKRELQPSSRPKDPRRVLVYNFKNTYAAHLDAVRKVRFHPTRGVDVMFTASEDYTLRMWTTFRQKLLRSRAPFYTPLHTFRGHTAQVYALEVADQNLFSAGYDGTIRCWQIPEEHHERDPRARVGDVGTFEVGCITDAHSDCIWSLAYKPSAKPLLSIAADGKLKGWDWSALADGEETELFSMTSSDFAPPSVRKPTCVSYLPTTDTKCAVSFTDSQVAIIDLTKEQVETNWETAPGTTDQVSHLVYEVLPLTTISNAVVSCNEDSTIGVFDLRTKKEVADKSKFVHNASVSCLAENTLCNTAMVATGCHDQKVRTWDFRTMHILQVIDRVGVAKGGEGVHTLAFHPWKDYVLAAGCADSNVKMYFNANEPALTDEEKLAKEKFARSLRRKERRRRKKSARDGRKKKRSSRRRKKGGDA